MGHGEDGMKLPQGKFVMLAGVGIGLRDKEGVVVGWCCLLRCNCVKNVCKISVYIVECVTVDEQILHYVGSSESIPMKLCIVLQRFLEYQVSN